MFGQQTLFSNNRHKETIGLSTRLLEVLGVAGWEDAFPELGSCKTALASLVRDVDTLYTDDCFSPIQTLGHGVRYSIQRMKIQ